MKKRLSAFIEEEVFKHAKQSAAQEGRSLGALIQDALISYLRKTVPGLRKREEAYQLFCERPIRLSRKQFNDLLKEESFKPLWNRGFSSFLPFSISVNATTLQFPVNSGIIGN